MDTINNKANDLSTRASALPASSQQQVKNSSAASPYTVTVGDTTVRLNFNGKGDLTAHLANAFSSMLR